jgi:cardiolipin synthase
LAVTLVSGRNSAVECQLPKLDVTGSIPVARSKILTEKLTVSKSHFLVFLAKKANLLMSHIFTTLATLLFLYALVTGVFLLMENRRPQSTLAWMLVFFFAPGFGLLVYLLFGRDSKAFSKRRKLLMQDLEANARPLLSPILSRQDAQLARLETESVSRRKLARLVRRNSLSALTTRNRVEIQQDAAKFYPSLIEDIKAAQDSIHLQYFIWAVDPFTNRLKQILIEKARAGIEVRLLYDPIGSQAHVGRRYVRDMLAAGIRMAPTSPSYQLHTISYRNHRKITVIDGATGYTGGMNIGQEQLDGGEGFDSWRDTQVRLVGESAAVLQAVFMVDWYNAVRENLFYAKYFPADARDSAEGDVPVQILTSGPDSQWAAIRQLYAFMIVSAQRHVYLQSPFFIPDATLAEALRTAALSGIDVKVMVSARPSGNRLPDWAGNTFIEDIVTAGVRVFLYEKGYLHAKTISIDSEICSIGSANIDIRSFSVNYELNAVFYSDRIAKELESDFERDLEYCSEFDPAAYRKRGTASRFRDSVARVLSPLL